MTPSSPMTISSGDAPSMTVGTTAQTSPSPLSPSSSTSPSLPRPAAKITNLWKARSPSLTPPPPLKPPSKRKVAAEDGAKKKKPKTDKVAPKPAVKKEEEDKTEKGTYCHQCRTKCDPEAVLRCTRLRKYTKHSAPRACNLAWCERDLAKRYDVVPSDVCKRGHDVSADELAKHDQEKDYIFACPCCLDECQNSTCRQKKGLERLGDVVKLAGEQGMTPLEFVRKFDQDGPKPTCKSREDAESDLTDLDAPVKKKATPKKKVAAKPKAAAKDAKGKAKTPTKGKGKDVKGKDAKGKGKEVKKPVPKKAEVKKEPVERPVDPPVFNMVNSRLSFEEVEHRIYLREFVNRFRGLLGMPDRSMAQLDDFDHPLSEASVRQIAGGLLDLIIQDEGKSTGIDPEDIEFVEDKREEMRHYADLARFAQVWKELSALLDLKMLPAETTQDRNDRAVRALLNLGENDVAPSWALETGPSRRAAASRLPSSSEVVRMLISLTDYVINIDSLRSTMDPAIGNSYNDYVKKNFQYNREENARWDAEKKALAAARVRCKTAEQTRANKAKFDDALKEHNMRILAGQVVLHAISHRKQTHLSPLGTDPDGRVYFALSPRLIEEERYRPSGWTRGVMAWGIGLESQAADDELPIQVPRWTHFSTAKDTRQLANWLGWRIRKQIREAEAAEASAKKKTSKEKTPKKATANGTSTPNSKGIAALISRHPSTAADSDSDADSELSEVPETTEDLLALLDPPGYTPTLEKIKDGYALVPAVEQVASLLEVLEWKGYN